MASPGRAPTAVTNWPVAGASPAGATWRRTTLAPSRSSRASARPVSPATRSTLLCSEPSRSDSRHL
eukprot:1328515-Alexandrium_andersonii.AAC.1